MVFYMRKKNCLKVLRSQVNKGSLRRKSPCNQGNIRTRNPAHNSLHCTVMTCKGNNSLSQLVADDHIGIAVRVGTKAKEQYEIRETLQCTESLDLCRK